MTWAPVPHIKRWTCFKSGAFINKRNWPTWSCTCRGVGKMLQYLITFLQMETFFLLKH